MGVDLVTLILVVLATARLTRLITTDYLTLPARTWLVRRFGPQHPVSYLVNCDWCVSIYAGTLVAVSAWAWGGHTWFSIAALALSASYATGYLASRLEE